MNPQAQSWFAIGVKCDSLVIFKSNCPLFFLLLSKRENGKEMTSAHIAYIHECTGPWWGTFQARPVWFCPLWCHKHERWTDVESQRSGCQHSWQRRADLALQPVREREWNREKGKESVWYVMMKPAETYILNIFTIWLVTPKVPCFIFYYVTYILAYLFCYYFDMSIVKPKPPCSHYKSMYQVSANGFQGL